MKPISEILQKFRDRAAALRAAAAPPPPPKNAAADFVETQFTEAPAVPPTRLSIYETALWDISQMQSAVPAVRAIALRAQEALREGKRYE